MKKIVWKITATFLFFCVFSGSVNAEDPEELSVGIKGGLNISNLYTKDATNSDVIPGLTLGVFANKPLTKLIAIESEFYLSTKGASVTYNTLLVDGTANFNLMYLEMPVLCKIKVSNRMYVEVGPYISYLIDGKVKNVANIQLFDFEQNINVSDYNRFDVGAVAGIGVVVHSISMGARYNYGFMKVGKEKTIMGTSYAIPNATNGVINFYISVPIL
jgi:hypothetical protein